MRPRYILGGMFFLLRWIQKVPAFQNGMVKILIYHDVPESRMDVFRRHILWLTRQYPFLNPDSFHAFLEGRLLLKKKHILISFDDGFLSSRKAAELVLNPFGIKALFFIPVGFIDLAGGTKWREYVSRQLCDDRVSVQEVSECQKPMRWDDVLWLRSKGHTIGAHTVTHCRLSTINNPARLEYEIVFAQTRLQQILGCEIVDFAYPFGSLASINRQAIELISENYKYCYSGVRGANTLETPLFAIRRDPVRLDDPPAYVGFLVEDGLGLYYQSRRKKLDGMRPVA